MTVAVQVWVGEVPEHSQEREAIVALARGLDRLQDRYLILSNFTVGGQAIDLAIFKRNGGFVIELKHCDGRVIGGVNGRWEVINANGEVHVINPGRRNPYNQVISYFYRLSNFLNQHRREFLSRHRAGEVDFRTCKRLVVISPCIHPDSEIVLDWKVDLKGLDELPTYLVTAVSSEISLSEEELLALPRLLRCEPWHDVNLLIGEEGLIEEAWPTEEEAAMMAGGEVVAVTEAVEEAASPAGRPTPEATTTTAPPSTAARPLRRPRRRIALLSLLALLLLGTAALGVGGWGALWGRLHPTPTATPPPTVTPIPLPPSPGPPPPNTPVVPCEQVEQAVTRVSAFADGEVEVVLRQACFPAGQIILHWTLVNHGNRSVRLSLSEENIQILDNIGNTYPVDATLSEPRVLVARPGERVEGRCTVPRAVSPDAITLRIYINGEPFEGRPPVWPINIPGRE